MTAAAARTDTQATRQGAAMAAVRVVRRLREAGDWQREMDVILETLCRAMDCQRGILFRLRELPGQGFAQSVSAYWINPDFGGELASPTVIMQSIINSDPLLERLQEDERQGKVFAGHTRDLDGFLRADFEKQNIKSFLSVSVFAHGHLWGTLAVNDCVAEREWTDEEEATLHIIALAIGDAIEHSPSDAHASEVIRRTMLQASLDAIVVIDETGSIIEFNPAAEKMFGFQRSDILGKDLLDTIVPIYYRKGYASGAEYMSGRGSPMVGQRLETVTQNSVGEVFPIELTATEMRVADRRLIFGSIRDLRDKLRAEEEIGRQREKLHQNEKMAAMGSLLAGVSHELNNPLAVVVAQSTLLHEFASDPQTKVRAEKVRAAAERCGRIVKSFLSMVRLHPTEQAETDLNQVIRAALEVTAYGARSSGIIIDTDFAAGPLLAMADADHVTQVAANFLVNSQHALAGVAGDRLIKVRTFRSERGNPGFSVEDNGPGVPDAIRSRIFESYFTTKPVGVGTGIGLSISKSIIERHNGNIWFEEVQPHGARFVVQLPAITAGPAAGTDSPTRSSGLRHALIIDDEPDVAGSLSDILELMGVKSRVVPAWTSAASILSGQMPPDIVFSDLRMPGTSGISIYRELLAERPALAQCFVLVTGDLIGAKAEIEALPPHQRPQILEKPFSTLDVRGVLSAIAEQASVES
ncbi:MULTISPECIES: hybrid sensor histidine kinase/response regulator [Mesorhizobium]|uniref:hybrid sensor histidine kinase/response regulator n=2 Tax=Phyllobacteriaceae TaxID=69277 RepID=UPI001FE159FE|nr:MULTISPECIES: hybrid sensor histidine kinase/response regulator [Mesorhizobium]MDX8435458.1 PAS domain S-box protein [Mesorhizobium abyssinicae]